MRALFTHSDHLGSTSYISTLNGQLSQHVEYIAFGEVLFEEHSSSFSMPYLFNGKELDRETNLTYFGARYLDMKTSLWLSIDPLAEKFPNISPYVYCFNNPIRFTDLDGREGQDWIKKGNNIFFDPTIKNQTDAINVYGDSAQHLGEGSTLTGTKEGKTSYQYTFHNNGTITDINNKNINNSTDLKTEGGITIQAPNQKTGNFASFSFGGAFLGGITLEIGFVNDDIGGKAAYFTFGGNAGLGGAAGFKAGKINPTYDNPFSISDFSGKGNSYSISADTPFGGYGRERGGSQGSNFENFGDNKRGYKYTAGSVGLTPSLKVEAMISETKTWTLPLE
ncbi:hypothetical protein B0A78_12865 [Flavobacterium columnare NBRC 100251 = ATCC 23463]|uniref:RHS repeat domain-containing protein n=1 Tax=Flavobacterium columnare TaxID=996 RepID=UPI000BE96486|nr:RHS repeat-associated core domain-containing protein [Flavobacterium columnare]PDS22139.1 hypothetical protein B0A78_12865 [Flavobacterium columnare NBRC 100251 = ATCC 23463]GEM59243.1 hypothetical protein FC1_24810 [Flavobacterium columnare NBRC 100251 = ATCC 23463]